MPTTTDMLKTPQKAMQKTVRNLRICYIVGLSVIALLVAASFLTMQRVISEQNNSFSLVNLASLMVTTKDEAEFDMAQAQVGRTINKMRTAYEVLCKGDPENGSPLVTNDRLQTIYEDPMVDLDKTIGNFLERSTTLYVTEIDVLTNTLKRLLAAQQLAMVGDWQFDIAGDNLTWSDQIYEICGVSKEDLQPTMNGALPIIRLPPYCGLSPQGY